MTTHKDQEREFFRACFNACHEAHPHPGPRFDACSAACVAEWRSQQRWWHRLIAFFRRIM